MIILTRLAHSGPILKFTPTRVERGFRRRLGRNGRDTYLVKRGGARGKRREKRIYPGIYRTNGAERSERGGPPDVE